MEEAAELEQLDELESLPELPAEEAEPIGRASQNSQPFKSKRLPTLLRLTRRMTVFLSLTEVAIIFFFMTGNKQTFLDSNLTLILSILACNAIALCFFSLSAILECMFYIMKNKKLSLILHTICYLLILAFSSLVAVFSLSVNLLSEGIDF